jgi:hypothetical protein
MSLQECSKQLTAIEGHTQSNISLWPEEYGTHSGVAGAAKRRKCKKKNSTEQVYNEHFHRQDKQSS